VQRDCDTGRDRKVESSKTKKKKQQKKNRKQIGSRKRSAHLCREVRRREKNIWGTREDKDIPTLVKVLAGKRGGVKCSLRTSSDGLKKRNGKGGTGQKG